MSRVATNLPTINYTNGYSPANKAIMTSTLTKTTPAKAVSNGNFHIRSAAPAPIQKETVHACPLCNNEYKDPRVLPCTHTYCFDCIREKLVQNSRLTCPKCHHQVYPFDEFDFNNLPPNLILSQEWRIGARPVASVPAIKKPVTYQSNVSIPVNQPTTTTTTSSISMPQHRDKRKGSSTEPSSNPSGIAAMVNTFHQTSDDDENQSRKTTPQPPVVSNLIRIYSEALPKTKPKENDPIKSTGKHDELMKIFEQASNQNQQRRTSSSTQIKQQIKVHEETSQQTNWDNLAEETSPTTQSFPQQAQSTIIYPRYPPETPQKAVSVPISQPNSAVGNLCSIETSIHEDSPEESPAIQPIPIVDTQTKSHRSIVSHSQHDDDHEDDNDDDNDEEDDDDEDDDHLHVHQIIDSIIPEREQFHQISSTENVPSPPTESISKPSSISIENQQQKFSTTSPPQQEDKPFYRTSSVTSSRRSSDRFPPPPQNLEVFDPFNNEMNQPRSISQQDNQTPEIKAVRTEHFSPDVNHSQISSDFSTPNNRNNVDHHQHHYHHRQQENLSFSTSSPIPTAVNSRVDILLSDQKRLEHEIAEQIRRLKYDYDDIRRKIDHKQSTIHNEVKNIATRLDDDITEHYQRKQKIYAELAADADTLGDELKHLKSNTNNNKQQLWTNLEQIELNIQNIRRAVEQHKETHHALTFAEGQQALGSDTIGRLTYPKQESTRHFSPSAKKSSPSPIQIEQPITSLTPYKFIKIDHLSTLEPEAIAITENNKKILLGICNKLFILNEFGDILKTIQLTPSIRGIAIAKKSSIQNLAYISHDEIVSMIDIDSGQTLDCVKETDSTGESGTFLPLGIDTDQTHGNVYVCDYRNSCIIKFDQKLEFLTQWRIYNHSQQYDEARPKLISVYGQKFYMIVEHSCKPYYNQGIAYTFSLHICDIHSGSIIKIIDAESLSTQRLRWPCSVQAINHEKCYILDTMTSGKYFNGQWQKHWSRVLEITEDDRNLVTELFQLDSEAATMAMTKQIMIIAANGEILFVDLAFIHQQQNFHE